MDEKILLHGGDGPDAEQPTDVRGASRGRHALGHGDQLLGLRQHVPAVGVERRRARASVEQLDAQVFLQPPDLGADRGLRQAKLDPGPGKGSVPRHGDEGLEFLEHNQFFRC